jgi:hypothetical protein
MMLLSDNLPLSDLSALLVLRRMVPSGSVGLSSGQVIYDQMLLKKLKWA